MVDGVAQEMRERFPERFDDREIGFGLPARDFKADLLADGRGQVAHGAGEGAEEQVDRHDARLHHALLQIAPHPFRMLKSVPQLRAVVLVQPLDQTTELPLADGDLAHQVEQPVELVHAN